MSAEQELCQLATRVLDRPDSPLSWTLAMVVIILPAAVALYQNVLKLRGAIPRSAKLQDIERALALAPSESLEWQMFKELQLEEVTFLITKLCLSKSMRQTVAGWLQNKAVTFDMILKAWYHIDWSLETPGIRLSKFDWFYAGYFSASYFVLFMASAWLFEKVIIQALQGQVLILVYPLIGFLLAIFFIYQTRTFRAAKRLRRPIQGEAEF